MIVGAFKIVANTSITVRRTASECTANRSPYSPSRHRYPGHPMPLEKPMIGKIITILAILAALDGCSLIQQKVEMDASTAAVIAANSGDAAGAACFKALEPVVGTAPTGLLSKFEVARDGQIIVEA